MELLQFCMNWQWMHIAMNMGVLLHNVKITELKTRDQQEVIGYYDTLELIYDNYENIPLTENYIKQLHQILLKHSDKDTKHRGQYKSLSNSY